MVEMAEKPTQQICFAFEYSHRERLKSNPSSSFSLDGEEQTHCVAHRDPNTKIHILYFSSQILALLHGHCFLIEHPQKANSPSSHCRKTKAPTQKSSKPSGKLDHLFPTAYHFDP
jgi:hypothetical protein